MIVHCIAELKDARNNERGFIILFNVSDIFEDNNDYTGTIVLSMSRQKIRLFADVRPCFDTEVRADVSADLVTHISAGAAMLCGLLEAEDGYTGPGI